VSDLRGIYSAMDKTNQSLKNSPMKRVQKRKCPASERQSSELEDPSSLAMIQQFKESAMKRREMAPEFVPEHARATGDQPTAVAEDASVGEPDALQLAQYGRRS